MKSVTIYKFIIDLSLCLMLLVVGISGSHFRGGTIRWRSEGGFKVRFFFSLGWVYTNGAGCKENNIGFHSTNMNYDFWVCQWGCTDTLRDANVYCSGASKAENWQQGHDNFTFTFSGPGPFVVGYYSNQWVKLSNKKGGGDWNISTVVDLRTRSDSGLPNSSPYSSCKPTYQIPFNCANTLKIPVFDPDGDIVRCRWSTGSECMSVCNALPLAVLHAENCTLEFNTSGPDYVINGYYAVAVSIEDFARNAITLDGVTKTTHDPLSTVSIQFIVKTITQSGMCNSVPRFVAPSPNENQIVTVQEGKSVKVILYADNGEDLINKITKISVFGIISMKQAPISQDPKRTNTVWTQLEWHTSHEDLGNHIVCSYVENSIGKTGTQRCFVIKVVEWGCELSPCQNGGRCVPDTGNYTCICQVGYTGTNCDHNVDDCSVNHCPPGTHCIDGVNAYTCQTTTTQREITTTTSSMYPIATRRSKHFTTTRSLTTTSLHFLTTDVFETVTHKSMLKENKTNADSLLLYTMCKCLIKAHSKSRISIKVSNAVSFLIGCPIGLLLSLATYFGHQRFKNRKGQGPFFQTPMSKFTFNNMKEATRNAFLRIKARFNK